MAEPAAPAPRRRGRVVAVLVLGIAALAAAVMMPPEAMRYLRQNFAWFNTPAGWVEDGSQFINLVHVALFAWIAAAWAALRPDAAAWRIALPLAVLAALSELAQVFAPGRDPRWMDLGWDVIGIGLGLAIVAGLRRWRRARP